MAQSFIDKYVFALMLDSSNFEKGANLATKAANGIKSTLLKTYSIVGGIDLFKNMVTDYTNAARSIDNLNMITGENITTLQAWQKSIQDVGGNVGAFEGTLKGLSQSFANLRQFGRVDERLGLLGWQGIDLYKDGRMKKASEVLLDISKRIKEMNESDAFSWASALGIDESTYRLFRLHGENLEQIIRKNEKWAVLKRKDIKATEQYDKIVSDFKQSWLNFSREITSSVLPVVQQELLPALNDMNKYLINNRGSIQEVLTNFANLSVGAVKYINQLMGAVGRSIGEIQGEFERGNVGGALGKTGRALGNLSIGGRLIDWGAKELYKNYNDYLRGKELSGIRANEMKKNVVVIQSMNVMTDNPKSLSEGLSEIAETGNPLRLTSGKLGLQIIGANNL